MKRQPAANRRNPTSLRVSEWEVPLSDLIIRESDIEAVADLYRSGWLTTGAHTEEFERAFARYTGARHAIAVSSGTAALHLACLAAGIGAGDEVIVPSLTFIATVSAVALTGARPVFADIAGLEAPWLAAERAEMALTDRTKAIMTMSYGGHPGETTALVDLAKSRGLVLLEDAAHAAGSRLDGRHLGTLGLAGCFSFFSNKNLAVGEGGMVVTDDDEIAEQVRSLRAWGVTKLRWQKRRGRPIDYDVEALGLNYRIDEPRAVLGLRQLNRLDEENALRSRLASNYREAFAEVSGITLTLPTTARTTLSHHLFTVLVSEDINRDSLRATLGDRGVETSVHYPPVHHFSYYARYTADLPLTEEYSARTLTLPMFPHMTQEQQKIVVDSVRDAIGAA
jgi:dTDP-4-amino-4,6-dideoxygalactose transaminase